MASMSLLEHEREVKQSRAKLSHDLAVLCAPDTFSAFTDDLKQQAFDTGDAFWKKLKARAASNPAAVIAIGAGLAWRLLQRPPITSALIGVGLYSLWKTQPKTAYDATGRRLNYVEQSKEMLKAQAGQALSAASDIAAKTQEAVKAKTAQVTEDATEKIQELRRRIEDAVTDTTATLKGTGEEILNDFRTKKSDLRDEVEEFGARVAQKVHDEDVRNTVLLGAAGLAIAVALGIASQRRLSENRLG